MLIVRDDSHYLDYSFYLIMNGITIGVWYGGSHLQYFRYDSGSHLQYFRYDTPIDFNQSNRRRSSELEFLVLVGHTAEEMFELGMRAKICITMEVGNSL